MNVLITSASAKIQLVQAFQAAARFVEGKVVAADSDALCCAAEFADAFEVLPRDDDPAFGDRLRLNKEDYVVQTFCIDQQLTGPGAFYCMRRNLSYFILERTKSASIRRIQISIEANDGHGFSRTNNSPLAGQASMALYAYRL